MFRKYRLLLLFLLLPQVFLAADNDITVPAKRVLDRILDVPENRIVYKVLPRQEGLDAFSISCENNCLTLSGTSTTALTYAFYTYVRHACHVMATWSGNNIKLPKQLPNYHSGVVNSPFKLRYFLNVCTFGYTMPYWDWERWEKELDLMALHGVNMPLASVASEAIAERVWMRMGLSKAQIREFFTGPAYLPWHRMGNLNQWDGPLSDAWHKQQITLQHKIISRMRELGMHPIAPAFAGFVPKAFAKKHPEINFKHLRWGGFADSLNAYVLPPESSYFKQLGKLFIEEWEREFGENTYYLSDSFNEMKLPVNPNDEEGKCRLLAEYGKAIYQSINAGNPHAIWVTQGWTFGYQHDFWNRKSLSALLSQVPNDRMIIIDLGNDYPKWVWHTEQTWKRHNGFYGKQWIFSYVPNFGGKTLLTGDLEMYATDASLALSAANKGNLVGIGSAPEGLENNEVVYELLSDAAWTDKGINLDEWIANYCMARYGKYPDKMKAAWNGFRKSVYSSLYSYPRFTWQTVIPDTRRKSRHDLNETYFKAVEDFLSCADELGKSKFYQDDAILFAAQYLGAKADIYYENALRYDSLNKYVEAKKQLSKAIELLLFADKILASHPTDRLDVWIAKARSQGHTPQEKNQYEANAKRLITTWGGHQEDYAARCWSGLIKDYYIPRIQIYFSNQREMLDQWEENWINKHGQTEKQLPLANPLKDLRRIISTINH